MFQNNSWVAAIGDVLHHLALPLFYLGHYFFDDFFHNFALQCAQNHQPRLCQHGSRERNSKKRVQFCYVMRNALIPFLQYLC